MNNSEKYALEGFVRRSLVGGTTKFSGEKSSTRVGSGHFMQYLREPDYEG
jgi:hypothetical protein